MCVCKFSNCVCLKTPLFSILPLYDGPRVRIRIGPANCEYIVAKNLLCRESSYFSRMFEGDFSEGEQQTATMEEIGGVVSVRSFEALLQWLYLRKVIFGLENPEDHISAVIEFVRLADMCNMKGMESQMAQHIKEIFVANTPRFVTDYRFVDTNTICLTNQHLHSATYLPAGHPVRRILAAASVEGFLRDGNHKFAEETQEYPTFGADLLQEIRVTLNGIKFEERDAHCEDPISGKRVYLNHHFNH